MRDIYSHYKFMRFKELRKYYAMLRRRQKIWYSIPFIVGFGGVLLSSMVIGGSFTAQLINGPLTGIIANGTIDMITWILFMLCTIFLPIEHTERYLAAPVLMGAFSLIPFLLFGALPVLGIVMMCYFIVAAVMMKPIAEQVIFMKSLPDFPFLERVELERMEYERSLLYTEQANKTLAKDKMPQKPHEEYDGSQLNELLDTLPARHLEDFHVKHGEFDAPEEDYTDKLSGSDGSQPDPYADHFIFDEPDEVYSEAQHRADGEEERYENIKDIEGKYYGDYKVSPKDEDLTGEEPPAIEGE